MKLQPALQQGLPCAALAVTQATLTGRLGAGGLRKHRARWPAALWLGASLVSASACLAQPRQLAPSGGHATRTASTFEALEQALQTAIAARSAQRLDALLHPDFEMIVAQDPVNPVARDEWLELVAKQGAAARTLRDLSAREFGDLALVSTVQRPTPARAGVAAIFVTDTWQRTPTGWLLRLRHVGPADGSRRGVPGDAGLPPIRKKY